MVVFVIHCCHILPAKQEAGSADLLKVTNISFCWVRDGIGAVKGRARLMEPKQQSKAFCCGFLRACLLLASACRTDVNMKAILLTCLLYGVGVSLSG